MLFQKIIIIKKVFHISAGTYLGHLGLTKSEPHNQHKALKIR